MATPNNLPEPTEHPATPRRLFLFDHCRTTSNLFIKVLGDDPNICKISYPFFYAFKYGPEIVPGGSLFDDRGSNDLKETYQEAFDRMTAAITTAEKEGKTPLIKEHVFYFNDPRVAAANMPLCSTPRDGKASRTPTILDKDGSTVLSPTNPTLLPDRFLRSISPIFLFRHPARLVPSYYRASKAAGKKYGIHDDAFSVGASLRWLRLLHDWYTNGKPTVANENTENGGISPWPIVIDSDDYIHEPRILQKLCAVAGLDPNYIRYEWDAVPAAGRRGQHPAFLDALQASRGLEVPATRDCEIDLEEERAKLVEEFGEHVGATLAHYVDLAMADYLHLRRFRLQ